MRIQFRPAIVVVVGAGLTRLGPLGTKGVARANGPNIRVWFLLSGQ